MKRFFPFMYALCLCLFSTLTYAQNNENCLIDNCNTNTLSVSTGVDQNTGTLYSATNPATTQDGFWELVGAPASQNVNFGPAWVIQSHPAWTTSPTSEWISAFNVSSQNDNNPSPDDPYVFQRCFCVCQDTDLTFDFIVYGDDQVSDILLDGAPLIPTPPYTAGSANHFRYGVPVQVTIPVAQGQHCLNIELRNMYGVAMGLMVDGVIKGANLLTSSCCDDSGSICGFKFSDDNQNGNWDFGESPLPNWTIQVNGPNGLSTQQTDQFGNYCFNGLAPGNYTVSEVNQAGWVQTFPSSPGTHAINLTANQVLSNVNFGNHKEIVAEPCDLEARYKVIRQENCYVEFQDYSSISNGNIVCTEWDFGDGTTTVGGPIVGHYYDAPGTYYVCLDVLAIIDGECCQRTYCHEVVVEGCEPEPCEIEVDFNFTNNNCTYDFNGQIINANANIDVWFWDFDDGTTATGQQASHTFNPGSYDVCLTAVVKPKNEDEDCCIFTVCNRVNIECDPRGRNESNLDERTDQLPVIDQSIEVYPNPTNSSLNVETNLEGAYLVKIYDTSGKQLHVENANGLNVELDVRKMNLNAGIYIIEIEQGSVRFREKFVFQK